MSTKLSAPFQAPLVERNLYPTQPWLIWLNDLWRRVGELDAQTNTEITENVNAASAGLVQLSDLLQALTDRVSQSEGSIASVQTGLVTANGLITTIQSTITTIQTALTTAQTNITTLQGQMTTVQGQITTLQSDASLEYGLLNVGAWVNI